MSVSIQALLLDILCVWQCVGIFVILLIIGNGTSDWHLILVKWN